MPLKIVCCVKQVLDPEAPAASFRIDPATNRPIPSPGTSLVVSQFDALAVEAAMRIRDAGEDVSVTILSLGSQSAKDAIKSSFAIGADEGILIDDRRLEADSYTTALGLSRAIEKIGPVDLVLCGRQAVDWDAGVTAIAIAEMLDMPSITITKAVSISDGRVRAERVTGDGFETAEAALPAVVTVSNEMGEPRYPKLPQIMAAGRKQITEWTADDLGLSAEDLQPRLSLERLFIPEVESQCEFISGDSPQEIGVNLARKLREARVL